MTINPVIFGSSGMIGQGVLMECLESNLVEKILLINRRSSGIKHPKVEEIIHSDFDEFSILENEFKKYNTCFFCLGVSAVGMNEEQYHKITYDITLNTAKTFYKANPGSTFIYISGKSTDSTEKGPMMWARVKGKIENALLKTGFKNAYMFRPGFIQPLNGIRSRTKIYNAIYSVIKPFYFALKSFKNYVTDTSTLGRAMINVAANGYEKSILESTDINKTGHPR